LAVGLVPVGSAPARPRVEITTTHVGDLSASPDAGGFAAAEARRIPSTATVAIDDGQMIGFDWAAGDLDHLEIEVRTGGTWSEPEELVVSLDEGPDPGTPEAASSRPGVGPVWVGSQATAVRVRLDHGQVRDLRVREIESIEPSSGALALPVAAAGPDWPGIRPRSMWGADESIRNSPSGCESSPGYAENVRNSFVHHTVSVNTYAANEADDLIRGIYAFHVRSRGWCDVGYNFFVDRYGGMWEGRWGGMDRAVIGAHAGGFNTASTGVALLGDHSTAGVTSAASNGLAALLTWKLGHHGVDPANRIWVQSGGSTRWPAGTAVHLPTIAGHRDVSATACPGNHGMAVLPGLRSTIAHRLLHEEPYPMAGYKPEKSPAPRLAALDQFGAVLPRGSTAPLADGPHWPGWSIAREIVGTSPTGGYVVDAWGGLHAIGDAPTAVPTRYRPGTDQIRGAVAVPGTRGGLILDAFGAMWGFGGNVRFGSLERWPGWEIARDVAVLGDGTGGYLLDGWGGLHPFGAAPRLKPGGYWNGWDIARGVALTPSGKGGWVLDGWGGLHPFGDAPRVGLSHYTSGRDLHRAVVAGPSGKGGWVLDAEGKVWPFGDAPEVRQPLSRSGFDVGRSLTIFPATTSGLLAGG
jgi:hypothetical protein